MNRFVPILLLSLAVLLTLLGDPTRLTAQPQAQLVVTHTETFTQTDGLGLRVYFVLRNAQNEPILQNEVRLDQQGNLELLGVGATAVEATVELARTPIKVLLLMDASGSMRPVIGTVRQAAQRAITSAPDGAVFAVAQFSDLGPSEPLDLLQPFTTNQLLVSQAIDAIDPQPQAPTCLYNAAFQAIETLKAAEEVAQERQAIILFTDGRDERADGSDCSTRSVDNVIAAARERNIPIYTIGLCEDADCGNLDERILRELAETTLGVNAIGELEALDKLFSYIMESLSSQWVAEGVVFPRQGTNRAAISVNVTNNGGQLAQTFEFLADRDYAAPPSFELVPSYDPDQDQLLINLRVTNPSEIEQVNLELWGSSGQLVSRQIPPEVWATPIPFTTERLVPGEEYCFRLRAVRRGGIELRGPDDEPFLLAECISYNPNLTFTINSVDPNWENRKLLIGTTVRGSRSQTPFFEGRITDKNGQTVATVPRSVPDALGNIILDLPQVLEQATPDSEFIITLTLEDGGKIVEQERGFRVTPPARDNVVIVVAASVGLALVVVAGVVLLKVKPGAKNTTILPPAPIENPLTQEVTPGVPAPKPSPGRPLTPSPARSLRVTILETSAPGKQNKSYRLDTTQLPCLIGRNETCQITIDDSEMSKTHVQLALVGRELYITDLSRNGTFISDRRLEKNQRVPITVPVVIRLGHHTKIKIDMV